jgi:hypothetical protein
MDDFQVLAQSWTWRTAVDNMWVPHNEHSMPLGRLSTWALIQVAGRLTYIPFVFSLQGPLALVAAAVVLYLFVRREVGHPVPALLAMALFGVSTHYQNAVNWFSASFSVLGLLMCLLGLLAAQRWLQGGRCWWLGLSALWCALGPGWFASGILAGPLCTLYLLGAVLERARAPLVNWKACWSVTFVPILGTILSLTITLPLNGRRIMDLPRVEFQDPTTALQTLDPRAGLKSTLRAMVDDVVPGALGVGELTDKFGWGHLTTPEPWVWLALAALVALGVWWWWAAGHRNLLLLGLGTIGASYLLTFTGRAYIPYEEMHHVQRYHLYPQLGLALFICGGWPLRGKMARLAAVPDWGVLLFLVALLYPQAPGFTLLPYDALQAQAFQEIEEVDARCRRFHIDAETARKALTPVLDISGCTEWQLVNSQSLTRWDFLRGSNDPRPVSLDEARRLLQGTTDRK